MKKVIKNASLIVFGIFMVSCNDYLDVQPEDKYIEDQVYSSKEGINNLLNGIYINITKPQLYGGNLTMSTVEILGQRYNLSNNGHVWYSHNQYAYNEAAVKRDIENIWTNSYGAILNINNLLSGLETQSVLTSTETNIIKGETFGLRAMLHFDLLRLFGPIYAINPSSLSIPYYKEAQASSSPLLPANEVLESVLADLNMAASLLGEDPILSNGVSGDPSNPFYMHRNLRLNFYAIKGLQARVNLYAGNNQAAFDAATMAIDAVEGVFPWTPPTQVITGSDPDRVFSSEVIFGVENLQLYEQQNSLFSSDLSGSNILAPNSFRLRETFENNENDYRYNSSWAVPAIGSYDFRTFFKYASVNNLNAKSRYLQPLIRKTEMYYIAAETSADPAQALTYLNTVRFNRGLIDLPETADVQNELLKEYRKEFYGEGQLFFYYKRKNINRIPDATRTSANFTILMSPEKYVVPLPDSETQFIN